MNGIFFGPLILSSHRRYYIIARPNPLPRDTSRSDNPFCTGKRDKIVELLLEKGADVKWTNNKGSSLLHFLGYSSMAAADKKALSLKLVEAGVNIDAKVKTALKT